LHICFDDEDGLIHTMAATPANISDAIMAGKLLYGEERCVHGDPGYLGIDKRKEHEHRQGIVW
jgi:IS5 family transposase